MQTTGSEEESSGMKPFLVDALENLGHKGSPFRAAPLAGDGSVRRFWRVYVPDAGISYITMWNDPGNPASERENKAYLLIGRHLRGKGIPVPEIYGSDLVSGWFIMEDLGDENLQGASGKGDRLPLYREIIRVLIRMQIDGSAGFDTGWTCQTETYDRTVMARYEAGYFKEAFLHRYLGLRSEWPELQPCFDLIAQGASGAPPRFFMHRDFQSRNIMVSGAKAGIIDWQGGRLGPLGYDLASLIIDPYTALASGEKEEIYHSYLTLLREREPKWVMPFQDSFPYLAIQRNLQILGAFSYLSKVGGKTSFERYIPKALETLQGLLEAVAGGGFDPLRDLISLIREKRISIGTET